MRSRQTLLLALPIAVLAVAGCGGGGGSTESTATSTAATTTAPTKAALIEQGDAICAEVNAAVGTVDSSSSETKSPAAQAADLYSGMVSSLKNLGTPQESAGYTEFSGAADELATAEGEVKLASDRSDTAALESAEASASEALSSFQAAAREYGFKECAEGPSAPVTSGTAEPGESESAEAPEEAESEVVEPEEVEPAPEPTPETGGAGGTAGGAEGGGTAGGESGGIGPG
ncbi:MAG TPA: hypothetical protein VHU14_09420 [Solirubrobacterales bacterium]|jgi:hypothetical protein|nr:hypothetical protein [Solirubrobacterales bacterium]